MPIHFSCVNCSKSYRVDDALAGRKATCKACGRPMQVPMAEPANGAPSTETGPMIDWDAIAAATSQPVAPVPMARVEKKTRKPFGSLSAGINPYRVARLIFGIAFMAASVGFAIAVRNLYNAANAPGSNIRLWTMLSLCLSMGFIFGSLGLSLFMRKTTRQEMNTPFLESVSRSNRFLYTGSCVVFLLVLWLGEPIQKDVAAMIIAVLGGGTVVRGIGQLMEQRKQLEKYHSLSALDRLIVGLLPLSFAAPYWIVKINKMLPESKVGG